MLGAGEEENRREGMGPKYAIRHPNFPYLAFRLLLLGSSFNWPCAVEYLRTEIEPRREREEGGEDNCDCGNVNAGVPVDIDSVGSRPLVFGNTE